MPTGAGRVSPRRLVITGAPAAYHRAGHLAAKLLAGAGLVATARGVGANGTLTISATGATTIGAVASLSSPASP
jgi:hypothetical protein